MILGFLPHCTRSSFATPARGTRHFADTAVYFVALLLTFICRTHARFAPLLPMTVPQFCVTCGCTRIHCHTTLFHLDHWVPSTRIPVAVRLRNAYTRVYRGSFRTVYVRLPYRDIIY